MHFCIKKPVNKCGTSSPGVLLISQYLFMMFCVKGYASTLPQDGSHKDNSTNTGSNNVTGNGGNAGQGTSTTVTKTTPEGGAPEDAGETTSGATSYLMSQIATLALIPYFLQ